MKFTTLLTMAVASTTTVLAIPAAAAAAAAAATTTTTSSPTPPAPTTFPPNIQQQIQTLQGYIQNVIKDIAQNAPRQTTSTDYSSTGRSLDFFLRNTFLPGGPTTCPQAVAGQPLPPQAKNKDQAIGYLQQTQLALIAVSQDAINNQFKQGIFDACVAVRQYGGAAMSF